MIGCDSDIGSISAYDSSANGQAAQYSAEHAGRAVLVYEGDELVFETYQGGSSVNHALQIYSGTKSFNCAIAAAAIDDGLLTGFNENVSLTITEWANDPNKSAITVAHLLSQTSGLDQNLASFALASGNKYEAAINTSALYAPGTRFDYGEVHFTVFAELMRRKLLSLGEDPLDYLKRRILTPIGLTPSGWVRDTAGNPMMSFGAILKAREWAKFGLFMKNAGSWGGSAIVTGANLDACLTPGGVMAGYGYGIWLNSVMPAGFSGIVMASGGASSYTNDGSRLLYDGAPSDLFALSGLSDNRVFVSRTLDIVVVRMGNGSLRSNWSDARFLELLLQ